MIDRAKSLTASECLGINRCISTALLLVNSAETQHRLRAIKQHERENKQQLPGPLYHMEDSIKGTIQSILDSDGASKEEIYNQLCSQSVELVLTAHPTEVNRKSVLRKYRKCTELLAYLERPDLLPHEQLTGTVDLQRIISTLWGMDEIRRNKPTVQKEAAGGLAIIDTSLWHAVPNYLRKLDAQCLASLGKRLPLEVCPIKFASWIGGDRDGNPNVTPSVTREVVLHQRLRAARLYLQDLTALESQLAMSSRFSPKMIELASSIPSDFHQRELYRRVIAHMRKRLVKTANEVEKKLENEYLHNDPDQAYYLRSQNEAESAATKNLVGVDYDGDLIETVTKAEDLLGPLRIMHESLVETGFELAADGLLSDIVRRLKVFGITLVPLDIREESTKHTDALDAITSWLGIGSYVEWDEEARINWLSSELSSRRPMFASERLASMNFNPTVKRTLQVFQTASELEPEALGAYVISQCQTASDVLAVMLLQKQFGMTAENGNMMRVAPLFETLNDLNNAPERLKTLFSVPAYVGAINGKQEVMVGCKIPFNAVTLPEFSHTHAKLVFTFNTLAVFNLSLVYYSPIQIRIVQRMRDDWPHVGPSIYHKNGWLKLQRKLALNCASFMAKVERLVRTKLSHLRIYFRSPSFSPCSFYMLHILISILRILTLHHTQFLYRTWWKPSSLSGTY